MRRIFTIFLLSAITMLGNYGFASEISFRVDLSNETVSPNGVHLAGSFNSWSTTATPMTHLGDDLYEAVVDITTGEDVEYKFINGNDWAGEESVPAECGVDNGQGGYNRFLTVPAQDSTLANVCFSACAPCGQPVDVTFIVNMAQEEVSPNGVHIAGSFQGWDPAATPMTNTSDDLYEVTVEILSGSEIQYKFINGNDWDGEESVPAECGVDNGQGGYNRFMTVPAQDTATDIVCFSNCGPCPPPPIEVEVTFSVDLANEDISPDGVFIAGSFNGWTTADIQMTNTSESLFETTLTLIAGENHEYKYINGLTWDDSESVPEECSTNGNRFITIPETDTATNLVCFGMCTECPPPPPEVTVRFRVDMAEQTVAPEGVHLAGSFNEWNTESIEMTHTEASIYIADVSITAGSNITYKFLNGITEDTYETVPEECGVDDGFGNFNRFYTVPETDVVLDSVCFGSCTPCGGASNPVNVSFRADMANEDVSPNGVHVTGNFSGWDPAANPMTNVSDDVYLYTATINAGTYIEYKFVNGDTDEGFETVPEACAQNQNRFLNVPETDTTLNLVCFGSCDSCEQINTVMVNFQVDMTETTVSPEGVYIAGNFQGWDPAANPMNLISENIYQASFELGTRTAYEYKFINGNTWAGAEIVPDECAQNENRLLNVGAQDTTLPAFCFGSCQPCQSGADSVFVSFSVDMSQENVSGFGVHIAGSFQDWNPASSPMELQAGTATYKRTFKLPVGSYQEYKFINGNIWGDDEQVPAECATNGNRFFTVPDSDTELPAYCYASCEPCVVSIDKTESKEIYLGTARPNPASGQTIISYGIDRHAQVIIELYDITGHKAHVLENRAQGQGSHQLRLSLDRIKPGVYYYRMLIDKQPVDVSRKLIVY